MRYKGYYILSEINCGWLLPNGIFYPCEYKSHQKVLNYLIKEKIIKQSDILIKFNGFSSFHWIDVDLRQLKLTKNQKEFIEFNKEIINPDILKELYKFY